MKKYTLIFILSTILSSCSSEPCSHTTDIVDVTNPITGRTWMDRNLGASRVAKSSKDALAFGDLYQWGRRADGHQCRNSANTTNISSTDQPPHVKFILNGYGFEDWRNPQNPNLWQGLNGVNNPCPSGYRLPTEAEWKDEIASWGSKNASGAFASPLRLPMAGNRLDRNGTLNNIGTHDFWLGFYWSSTVNGTDSRYLAFHSNKAYFHDNGRANGFSVRCIKD
tara:strand:- start:11099 stop:11767 length:669 start_codon:yes stop_codon:yes gene_type:complete